MQHSQLYTQIDWNCSQQFLHSGRLRSTNSVGGMHIVCYCIMWVSTVYVHSSSWLIGPRPEFVDPKFVAQGEGRESKPTLVLTHVPQQITSLSLWVGQFSCILASPFYHLSFLLLWILYAVYCLHTCCCACPIRTPLCVCVCGGGWIYHKMPAAINGRYLTS